MLSLVVSSTLKFKYGHFCLQITKSDKHLKTYYTFLWVKPSWLLIVKMLQKMHCVCQCTECSLSSQKCIYETRRWGFFTHFFCQQVGFLNFRATTVSRQAAHLQLLSKVTEFTLSCCCAQKCTCHVQHEIRLWLRLLSTDLLVRNTTEELVLLW